MQNEYGMNSADWWGEGEHPGLKLARTLGLALIGVVVSMFLYAFLRGLGMLWGWV